MTLFVIGNTKTKIGHCITRIYFNTFIKIRNCSIEVALLIIYLPADCIDTRIVRKHLNDFCKIRDGMRIIANLLKDKTSIEISLPELGIYHNSFTKLNDSIDKFSLFLIYYSTDSIGLCK